MEASTNETSTDDSSERQFEENFITAVLHCHCLYSKKNAHYGTKAHNDRSWLKVARAVQKPIAECKDMWNILFQIFLHFTRLEQKFDYDWLCARWCHYKLFKKIQSDMANNYTEFLTMKCRTKPNSFKECVEILLLIQEIELRKDELMNPITSCKRRHELWSDIAICLNEKFPIPQRCVIDWQMVWWELKQATLKTLNIHGSQLTEEQTRALNVCKDDSKSNTWAILKFSMNHEFDENVNESICINCPSTDTELTDGLCSECRETISSKCEICMKAKSVFSFNTTAWSLRANKLIPKSCRNKEKICICERCHVNLKEQASRLWKICRVCGENKHPLENLMHRSYVDLREAFRTITGYKLRLSDGLPCFACIKCRDDLMEFVRIYLTFTNTQDRLLKIQERELIGDESMDKPLISLISTKGVQKLSPKQLTELPRKYSKRLQIKAEKKYYLETHNDESKSTFEEAAQSLPEDTNSNSAKGYLSPAKLSTSRSQMLGEDKQAIKKQTHPVKILKTYAFKRDRRSPPSLTKKIVDDNWKSQPDIRSDQVTNSAPLEENNAERLTETPSDLSQRVIDVNIAADSVYSRISTSSPKVSNSSANTYSKTNKAPRRESLTSGTITKLSDFSSTESESERGHLANANSSKKPLTASKSIRVKKLSHLTNSVKPMTKQKQSRRNSASTMPNSSTAYLQINSESTSSDRSISKEEIQIVSDDDEHETSGEKCIDKELEEILAELNRQSQVNKQLTIAELQVSDEETCEVFATKDLSKLPGVEMASQYIKLETPTPPLLGESNEVNDVDSSESSQSTFISDGSRATRSMKESPKRIQGSTPLSVRQSPELTIVNKDLLHNPQSVTQSPELTISVTRPSEQLAIQVQRSAPLSVRQSPELTIVSGPSEQLAIPSPTHITRDAMFTKCNAVKRKRNKSLGEMLLRCIVEDPSKHAKATMNTIIKSEDDTEDKSSSEYYSSEPSPLRNASPSHELKPFHLSGESTGVHSALSIFLPDVKRSREIQLDTDISLLKTLISDDNDIDMKEVSLINQNQAKGVGRLQQSSLINRVIERSFRTESSFLQIANVCSLNGNYRNDQAPIVDHKTVETIKMEDT